MHQPTRSQTIFKNQSRQFSQFNADYLKKLHGIYFSHEEISLEKKIVDIKNLSNLQSNEIILINLISE